MDNLNELVPVLSYLDTYTAISALARLGDPDILLIFMFLIILLKRYKIRILQPLLDVECDR